MISKSVSVVIPNFNGKWLLEKYLPFIYKALNNSSYISDYEVIVVDDASTDDSVNFLMSHYAKIIILQNGENSGFSKTINKGVFAAKMDLLLLLNTDMLLPKNFFDFLIPCFFSNPILFGISPAIKNEQGDKFLEMQKLPIKKHSCLSYRDVMSEEIGYSLYLCGGCALVDRMKLLKINGFNEMYSPFYYEDTDLSIRAWLNGWECIYTPKVSVRHCHSVTINEHFPKEYVKTIFARNKLLFNYLYLNGFDRFLFFLRYYMKYILGKILPFRSMKRFNSAFKMYQKMPERKKMRKELIQSGMNSLNTVLLNYFNQKT